MTREEFAEQTQRLCDLYGKTINQTQADFWLDQLQNYSANEYRRAVGEYAKKNKYMPAISDILTEIKNLKPYEQPKKEVVECKACNGTGYVLYKKVIDGREYEFASQCNCQNAVGLDYDGRTIKDEKHRSDYYLAKAVDVFGGGKCL